MVRHSALLRNFALKTNHAANKIGEKISFIEEKHIF